MLNKYSVADLTPSFMYEYLDGFTVDMMFECIQILIDRNKLNASEIHLISK